MELTRITVPKEYAKKELKSDFLSNLFLNHPIPTAVLDKNLQYRYCNKAYSETLSFSRQFLIGKSISKQFKEVNVSELREGENSWKAVSFRGGYFNIEVTPLDKKDIKKGYYVTLFKIPKMRNKASSFRLEGAFRSIFINSKIGIALLNDQGEILKVNPALQDFLGYSEAELQQKTFVDLTHDEDIDKDVEQYNLLIRGRIDSYTMEKRYYRKDGEIIWGSLKVSLERAPNNKVVHVIGMVEDITEKKKYLRQIKENEERLNLAIEGTRAGLWDWDIQNNQMTTNDWYHKMIGYSSDEISNVKALDWNEVHPEDIKKSKIAVQKYFNGENPFYEYEGRVKHKNDEWVWVSVRGKVSERDENGQPIRMTGTRIDISKRKKAELELQKYQTQLEEMVDKRTIELKEINEELQAFAYSISHDLRTPLRHIQGFSKLLERDLKLTETQTEFFGHVKQGASKMSNMIDALLSFSRLGRRILNKSDINLNELIPAIISDLLLFDKNDNINWKIADLPIVQGDIDLLQIVFENIINNAIKFSKKENNPTIEIGTLKENKNTIYVKDNGVGFEMEFVEKLFGVFQRLHRQEEFEGIGIGLANAKRIILKHNGKIWGTSERGQGATFYIQL